MGNIFTSMCSDENVETAQDTFGLKHGGNDLPMEQAPSKDTVSKVMAIDKKADAPLVPFEKAQVCTLVLCQHWPIIEEY